MQQDVLDELEALRRYLKPFHTACDEICNRLPAPKVHCIIRDEVLGSLQDKPPSYTMYLDHTALGELDAETSMPHDTHISIRNAIPKLNMCDYAVLVFLPYLTDVPRKINARVDWLFIEFQPLFNLCLEGCELPKSPKHSIFSITTSGGEQFIADFTIEQFGYHGRYWITPKAEYLEQYTTNGAYHIATDDDKEIIQDFVNIDRVGNMFQHATYLVCSAFDWQAYCQLPLATQKAQIRAFVRHALERPGVPTTQDNTPSAVESGASTEISFGE
ncbi:hypothetical protein T440DRAFT_270700 [Plenodomus tracheiphilus IPT5]|uniref:Uncharacterized protein n=1 Tax=Plenodomus tracheiphilus IPT5 TaxID=1408161 RepID=A0A6A7BFM3_9PLEO|nr:hypothetical protein T440DRAFT_270700 [Plenodomus tracheiphilus IPT5]